MKKELIFLGPPACGKGTQTNKLSEYLGFPHIDTGSLLRAEIAKETEEGLVAKSFIDKGQLVPIDLVATIIGKKLAEDDCKNGFILDGFPRTIPQAEALVEHGVNIDKVLSIAIEDQVILERLLGRRECSKCGRTYHLVHNPPKSQGVCDADGAELISRKDDNVETILSRLEVYHKQTEPLVEFYKNVGNLVNVQGRDTIEDTTQQVLESLGVKS